MNQLSQYQGGISDIFNVHAVRSGHDLLFYLLLEGFIPYHPRGHNDKCPSKYCFRSFSRALIANLAESWKLFVTSGMGRDVARKLTQHCPWRLKSSDKSRSLQESAPGHSSSASTTMKFLELCSITAASTFVSSLTDGRVLLPLYRP